MTGPVRPDEVRREDIPEGVFEAFNTLIAKNWDGRSATVRQDEAAKLAAVNVGCSKQKLYAARWMDVEQSYRQVGWKVTYDKPGYNESYPATFKFER